MKKTAACLALLLMTYLVPQQVFSAETKKRVAILDFKAINTKETYANAVRNIFEVSLYKKGAYEILERNRVDTLLREKGIQTDGCADISCAIRIGRILSADIIVMGSLNLLGRYTIAVKFVDVSGSNILLADSEPALSEDGLNEAVNVLAERMSGRISPSGERAHDGPAGRPSKHVVFHLTTVFSYLQPIDRFRSISDYGLGATLGFNFEILPLKHYCIGVETGYWYLEGAKDSIRDSYMVPLLVTTSYRFIFRDRIFLAPSLSGGATFNGITYDPDGSDSGGGFDFTTETQFEGMMKAGLFFGYMFGNLLSIQVGAEYGILFENRLLHFMAFTAGLGFRF